MTLLACDQLLLRRDGKSAFTLGPLTLTLPAQRRTALVGPSGCGKTTLLRLLAGLETATAGTICFADRIATNGSKLALPPAARGIGFVFQDGALWPHMDAVAHLRFADPCLSVAQARDRLARVGLQQHAHCRPGTLSGGERQRLALARALVGAPRVLLLDEPLHSVDAHLRGELATLIRELADELAITLVLVTHDRSEALAIADHAVVLREGQLVEQGEITDLLAQPKTAFTAAFLAGATCLPCERMANGKVSTPFGEFATANAQAVQLAILPGDAVLHEQGQASARVVWVQPTAAGPIAHVQIGAGTFQVAAHPGLRPNQVVRLALVHAPRLLPTHVQEQRA